MSKPLLFLDVDGVLNVPGWRGEGYDAMKQDIGGFPCWVPAGTKERVQRLLEHYDPVWCTAWLGRAHSAWRDVLDLDPIPWPYVEYYGLKLPALIRYAGEHRWAWIDDDAYWEMQELKWTPEMVTGLVFQIDGRDGLTDDNVTQLITYAQEGT